jgi:precorrin-6A/cobalt-precorrin-6A reductase
VRIWLIGGTSESRDLADAIASRQFPCLITVTTPEARALYADSPYLTVWVGRLAPGMLLEWLQQQQIVAIVDASHPFATAISASAIALARQCHLPYLRYERPLVTADNVIYLDCFQTLLKGDYLHDRRVLLTVGVKVLPQFRAWCDRSTLFARVLPTVQSITAALDAGFSPDRVIAMRPPFTAAFERALWQQWQISLVVTKASGRAGGEAIKQQVAAELGIPLIAIARPAVNYPQQTAQLDDIMRFCQRSLRINPNG